MKIRDKGSYNSAVGAYGATVWVYGRRREVEIELQLGRRTYYVLIAR